MHRRTDAVQSVTDARRSLSEDVDIRMHRYLLIMGIRTACLMAAVFAPVPIWGRLLFIVGAIVLPYIAVVDANSRHQSLIGALPVTPTPNRRAIESGPSQPDPDTLP